MKKCSPIPNSDLIHAVAVVLTIVAYPHTPLAQGLDAEGAIDTIVGSDISTAEEQAASEPDRILAAIEATSDNVSEIRKRFYWTK